MADTQVSDNVSNSSGGYMLTTVDNPFDPFTQWRDWFAFDEAAGYHSCSLLARITITSDELSDLDQEEALQLAIEEVVRENVSGVHRKVSHGEVKSLNE